MLTARNVRRRDSSVTNFPTAEILGRSEIFPIMRLEISTDAQQLKQAKL